MTGDDVDERLEQMLLESKLITKEQRDKARSYQIDIGGDLGKILVKLGFITETELASVLSRLDDVAYTDLSEVKLSPSLMNLLPRNLMEERLVLPIKLEQGTLTVAMADPSNLQVVEEVQFNSSYNVLPILVLDTDIREKLNHYYYDGKAPQRTGRQYALSDLVRELGPGTPAHATQVPKAVAATPEQRVEALKRLLVQKGVVTESEFEQELNRITREK